MIKRDRILSEGMTMMGIPSLGGIQETTCLKLEFVNGWLFTIDENRVKDENVRERVLTYKRDCYQALYNHFHKKHSHSQEIEIPHITTSNPTQTSLRLVSESRLTWGQQAAREIWVSEGLPLTPAMLAASAQGNLFTYVAKQEITP